MRKLTKKQQKSKNHINFQFTKKCKKAESQSYALWFRFFVCNFTMFFYLELQDGSVFLDYFVCIKIRGTGILNKVKKYDYEKPEELRCRIIWNSDTRCFVISVSRQQMGKAVRNKVCAEKPRK